MLSSDKSYVVFVFKACFYDMCCVLLYVVCYVLLSFHIYSGCVLLTSLIFN